MKNRLRLRLKRETTCTKNGVTGRIVIAALIILVCAVVGDAHAYTYTYTNGTGYLVKVTAQLYDDADKTAELKANGSYTISSKSLLKSWVAEVFLADTWQQVLNMTCDLLPGDHTFSIYVDEKKDTNGVLIRTWNALIK
ncbi:MAG TPA: hypothetical protein VKF36_17360 [Syntrophorhabdales bacterium]|nr:hypothetical protein [Syntrophorhabdales bacterium]